MGSFIFQKTPTALFIVAVIGAATAIFAATIGLAQNDIKKVLAYSTVSQLGYMFLACGVGAFVAAIFHVMTHAFSKDEILWKTWSSETTGTAGIGKFLWVVGIITAGLTAVYMTRLMVMTFWGKERFRDAHAGGEGDEAHAHAYDEGRGPHDAHTPSEGDRPHHAPGDAIDTHAHDIGAHGGAHH